MEANATLILGETIEAMGELPSNSFDLILADLPYGTTACKWDSIIPLKPLWIEYERLLSSEGTIALHCAQPFTSKLVSSNFGWFKYEWVWRKNKATGFLNAKHQPLRNHESIAIFRPKRGAYFPQKSQGHKPVNSFTKHTSDGATLGATKLNFSGGGSTERYPTTVLDFPVVNQDGSSKEGKFHPTQKPLALLKYLVNTYTNKGQNVLDNTMGSGSTGVACVETGRRFTGIELDENFYKVAVARISEVPGVVVCEH